MKRKFYVLIGILCFAGQVKAVPVYSPPGENVVASQPTTMTQSDARIMQQTLANLQKMDLPGQLQQLQQQIQSLQGQIEVLQHKLERLDKQQRLQYQDLQQQMQAVTGDSTDSASTTSSTIVPRLSIQPAVAVSSASGPQDVQATPKVMATAPETHADKTDYQAAYALVQSHQYQAAISAFEQYLTAYPEGQYAVNAYYWLGELYAHNGHDEKAQQSFKTVINDYSGSSKVADATLKLGVIAVNQKQTKAAQEYFERVIAQYPESSAARLAKQELQRMQ